MPRKEPEPVRITSANPSHSEELAGRQRRYVISMAIRTVCFLLAVVFAGGVLMWIFIAASFILPPVAVIIANAQAPTDPEPAESSFDPTRPELEPPPAP
ncbi:MAG TPA: DUF3099 domain-containing protein [Nocardioidaceae bacterium]|nr:DUF3099 domain-containing protein [Nocardioidaceae bacterium]